jgi:hypothetical protein
MRKRLLAAGKLLATIAPLLWSAAMVGCSDSLGLSAGTRYQLKAINTQLLPVLLRTHTQPGFNYFGYVDSGAVEVVDDTSGFIAFAVHEVAYLENGDSLTGGWLFRARARLRRTDDRLILDYRSREFQPPYGWDFMGVDTADIGPWSLVILGDSLSEGPRTVYLYVEQ